MSRYYAISGDGGGKNWKVNKAYMNYKISWNESILTLWESRKE